MTQFSKNSLSSIGIVVSTLFMALFCDIKALNSALVAGGGDLSGSESGPMAYLYLFCVLGALFSGVLFSQWQNRKFSSSIWFITIWVTAFYLITYVFIGSPYTSFALFAVLTVSSFLLPSFTIVDGRLFLKASMFFAVPAVFRLSEIFYFVYDSSDIISMGQSYAFLFPVVATIVYLFIYFKKETRFQKIISFILVLVNFIYAYYLIMYGSRGAVLSVFAVVVFLLVFHASDNASGVKMKKGRLVISLVLLLVVSVSFLSIIHLLQGVLGRFGTSAHFVNKFLFLEDSGDITNGRQWLYSLSFTDIASHPLFGMGMDQFYNNHGYTGSAYPHNFIIQTLYDGGVILFLVLFIPVMKGLVRAWKSCSLDEFAVLVALAFSAVPRALFSGDFWQNGQLWMMFGILLCRGFVVNGINKVSIS